MSNERDQNGRDIKDNLNKIKENEKEQINLRIFPKNLQVCINSPSADQCQFDKFAKGFVTKKKSYIACWN